VRFWNRFQSCAATVAERAAGAPPCPPAKSAEPTTEPSFVRDADVTQSRAQAPGRSRLKQTAPLTYFSVLTMFARRLLIVAGPSIIRIGSRLLRRDRRCYA